MTCFTLVSVKKNILRLQLMQKDAARLLTRCIESNHIAPILAVFNWLPLSCGIDFNTLLLVFKAVQG